MSTTNNITKKVAITPIELKTVKQVIDMLNEEFPVKAIPTVKLIEGKLKRTHVIPSDHFSAYKSSYGVWWVMVDDYGVWDESYKFLVELCNFIRQETQVKSTPCFVHPVFVKGIQQDAKEKRCIFIGKLNW